MMKLEAQVFGACSYAADRQSPNSQGHSLGLHRGVGSLPDCRYGHCWWYLACLPAHLQFLPTAGLLLPAFERSQSPRQSAIPPGIAAA